MRTLVFRPLTIVFHALAKTCLAILVAAKHAPVPLRLRSIFGVGSVTKETDLFEHHASMKLSKCYRATNGRLGCLTCHNPHEPLKQDGAYYDSKCIACHSSNGSSAEVNGADAQTLAAKCRVGTKDCVSCHMPKIGPREAHFKFTDHYIRITNQKETHRN